MLDYNNPLSTNYRASKNSRSSINWVYKAQIFSVTENKLFHQKISEINQGSQAFEQNSIGEYMIPIENKIVFTNGNYEAPYISEIIEVLTEYSTEFEDVKERIYNVEKGKSEKYEATRILEKVYGNGIIVTYRAGISGVYGWEDGKRKGRTRRAVINNYLKKQNRTRNDRQGETVERVSETSERTGISERAGEAGKYSRKEKPIDVDKLLEENEELSTMNEQLQEMLAIARKETTITGRHNLSRNSVDNVATYFRQNYGSTYSKRSLSARLDGFCGL